MFVYFYKKFYDFFILISTYLLKTGGHIPKKLAIIMDGNRRFAEKKHLKKIEGHKNVMDIKIILMKKFKIFLKKRRKKQKMVI